MGGSPSTKVKKELKDDIMNSISIKLIKLFIVLKSD